jgi:hypothetical protein
VGSCRWRGVALDISQVPAGQMIYIEDQPMFVQAAEALGIRGIHHTDCPSTCAQLALVGLKVAESSAKRDGVFPGWLFFLCLLAVQASASAHGVLPCSGPSPVARWSSARRGAEYRVPYECRPRACASLRGMP